MTEPLAIELHNTIRASGGRIEDELVSEEACTAWVAAVTDLVPIEAASASVDAAQLRRLRGDVRAVLAAALAGVPLPPDAVNALNEAAARAPVSAAIDAEGVVAHVHHGSPAEVLVAAIAANAIELTAGPERERLHACGAPGCVLMFVKQHARREWCSPACGNRARQARHYARTRGR